MSHAIAFDTLAFTKKLREAGVPEAQAEVHAESIAELVNTNLATKDDLEKAVLKITIRMGAMQVAAIGILATLIKFL